MLLPLHFNFCRTTLKNEASGNEASRSVFLALRMVTIDPRSTWIGLRPSRVKNTGYSGSLASISMVDPSATIIDRLVRTCGQIGVITAPSTPSTCRTLPSPPRPPEDPRPRLIQPSNGQTSFQQLTLFLFQARSIAKSQKTLRQCC